MKRKLLYCALMIVMIVSVLFITGCGDISELAGNASGVVKEEPQEPPEELATQKDNPQQEANSSDENKEVITVVLNTNPDRKRIHIPETYCASQIHDENYLEWTGSADELEEYAREHGYVACGSCHPDSKLGIDLPKK